MVIVESSIEELEVLNDVVLVLLDEEVQDVLLLVVLLLKVLIETLVLESDLLLLGYVGVRLSVLETAEESLLLVFDT